MCSGDQQRARRRDECFVDVVFGNRHVGAILAEEDERERVAVLDAEHDASGQAPRIGADMRRVASFLLERLDEEASHRIVADARDQRGLQPQPRAAECRVRRRASEILGKARDILEPRADLLRVEVLAEAAEGDDVKGSTLGKAGFVIHRRSGLLASFRRLCRWALVSLGSWERRPRGVRHVLQRTQIIARQGGLGQTPVRAVISGSFGSITSSHPFNKKLRSFI